jgi:hypothetical protein
MTSRTACRRDREQVDAILRYLAAWHALLEWAPDGLVPARQQIAGLKQSKRLDGSGTDGMGSSLMHSAAIANGPHDLPNKR